MHGTHLRQVRFPKKIDPEVIKRCGWRDDGILVINLKDPNLRLSWADRELLRTLGEQLYGPSSAIPAVKL